MDPEKQIDIFNDQQLLQLFIENVDYRVARNRQELEAAYGLVYKEYLKRGYIKPDGERIKLSIFNALPQTTTFVAILDRQIVATATVSAPFAPFQKRHRRCKSLQYKHLSRFEAHNVHYVT